MGYRNLFLQNTVKLSVKNEQLVIDGEQRRTVPLEDIECIAMDNLQCVLTAYTVMKLAEHGITLFVSNEQHMPTAALMPINCHSRKLQVLQLQKELDKPTLKRIWQQIVIAKIGNQAEALRITGNSHYIDIASIKQKVKSGDSDNMEAVAAAAYFKLMFGASFSRGNGNVINAALNYGYAILRSTIAKYLCLYGFEPAIGIFHHSTQNNFNLADDIIETFRPVVDLHVERNFSEDMYELSPSDKAHLVGLLGQDVQIENKNYAVSYAIEKTIQSLSGIVNGNRKSLLLPILLEPQTHEYE